MFLKKISLIISLAILTVSCVVKPADLRLDSSTLDKIAYKNRTVCAYKGKIVLNYTGKDGSINLKGFLDKDCSKDFHLVLTGFLNMVVMDITYKDGKVTADKNGEDVSRMVTYFFKQKDVDSLTEMIRYPYAEVDSSFSISIENGEYVLKKDDITVKAGEDYLIKSVTDGRRKFSYTYKDSKMYNINYEYKDEKAEIGLR